jgi:hypothetical protein
LVARWARWGGAGWLKAPSNSEASASSEGATIDQESKTIKLRKSQGFNCRRRRMNPVWRAQRSSWRGEKADKIFSTEARVAAEIFSGGRRTGLRGRRGIDTTTPRLAQREGFVPHFVANATGRSRAGFLHHNNSLLSMIWRASWTTWVAP